MSVTINFVTVAASIANLSIQGVKILDAGSIPTSLGTQVRVLQPRPRRFVTNFRLVPVEQTRQNLNAYYTLNYNYYYAAVGGGLPEFKVYAPMLNDIAAIAVAFAKVGTLSGATDNSTPKIGDIAAIQDNAGNLYHGCEISIDILQFLEES